MTYRITARWIGCSLNGISYPVDIVELNHRVYCHVPQDLTNDEVENIWNTSRSKIEEITLEDIRSLGDPWGALRVLEHRNPDWIYVAAICDCGSEAIYGNQSPHSHWCSKAA